MNKSRLEAFADGVFAIVITLLVLDIHLPDGVTRLTLGDHLRETLPSIGTYVLSFLVVGLYWVYHHQASQLFKKIDPRVLWFNILNLLFVGFLPFTTSLFGKFTFDVWAIGLYGLNLVLLNAAGYLTFRYLDRHPELAIERYSHNLFRLQQQIFVKTTFLYIFAILIAFFAPTISIYIFAAIAVFLIFATMYPRQFARIGFRGNGQFIEQQAETQS